jgi:predicted nucleic acid-binding protein
MILPTPRKQQIAQGLVRRAPAGEAMTSTQMLGEFAATLMHKVRPPVGPKDLAAILDVLGPVHTISTDGDMVRRVVEVHGRYGLPFYKSPIIAAAERAGCECIWSEDLSVGQKCFGVTVQNPF